MNNKPIGCFGILGGCFGFVLLGLIGVSGFIFIITEIVITPENNKKQAQKPPALIPYKITGKIEDPLPYRIGFDVEVDLIDGRLPTPRELLSIGQYLKRDDKERTFVRIALSWFTDEQLAFATCESTPENNNTMTVEIIDVEILLDKKMTALAKADLPDYPRKIKRVVDADTIKVCGIWVDDIGAKTVRLIGIDAPESYGSKKLESDMKRTGQDENTIKEQGKAATEFVKTLCSNQTVTLEYDENKTDKYGRTLAYVHLSDGRILNEEIIKSGYAMPYTKFPFRDMEKYIALGKKARETESGLWAKGMK